MIFDYVEGHVMLSALWDFDEYFLPRFIVRDFLYKLIKELMDKMQIDYSEDKIPRPNLFEEEIDGSRNFEIELGKNDLDVIKRAVDAGNFKEGEPAYPKYIQDASDSLILRVAQALGDESYQITPENMKVFNEVFFGE
ncbi:MAG: hypothetical protein HPY61_14020 [Methanotrichaceae archaeon]|nr:hypothetical protein [Methanotrichaceae archaeon]